ncbi:9838_t:CDS:2 [Acaulospora morrowiae]|uniref:9838_t:CDS:1 n=1 Tax=Acaulospora morrowiae TaxID=94023 RepID=A0A9N8VWT4_9GLOM|nr:9838_t:CDS:2 [Acaulospora morrowiae]
MEFVNDVIVDKLFDTVESVNLPTYIEGVFEIGKILSHVAIGVLTGNISLLVDDIVSFAYSAKHCKAECKRLSEQAKIARDSAKELLNKLAETPKEIEDKSFASALKAFSIVLEDARAVVKQHAEAKYGLKIFYARKFAAEFQDIEDRLDQACHRLNFAISIRHFVESQELEEAHKTWHEEDKVAFAKLNTMVKESLEEIRGYKKSTSAPSQSVLSGTRISLAELSDFKHLKTDRLFTAIYHTTDSNRKPKDAKVVIKVTMARESVPEEESKFALEVAYLQKLAPCPNIIDLIGITSLRNNMSLVLEYCENGDLRSFIAAGSLKDNWGRKRQISLGVALGMEFLHKAGILHKYINSANILLDGHFQAKITNFRKSRWTNGGSLGLIDSFEEQIRWTAPERLGDDPATFTEECDVFSYGVVFYEIVTEEFPWQGLQLDLVYKYRSEEGRKLTLSLHTPPAISTIYTNCTKTAPKQRFTTSEIIEHLEAIRPEELENVTTFEPIHENNGGAHFEVNKMVKEEDDNLLKVVTSRDLSLSDISDEEDMATSPQEIIKIAENYHQIRDYARARVEFEKVQEESPRALFRLGEYYYYGRGVNVDVQKAVQYLERAVEGGDGDAIDMLGYMYLKGQGLPKDRIKAVKLFTMAVEKGIPYGMYHLGVCYNKGCGGLKKDEEESKRLILKAASLGNMEAQHFARQKSWDSSW